MGHVHPDYPDNGFISDLPSKVKADESIFCSLGFLSLYLSYTLNGKHRIEKSQGSLPLPAHLQKLLYVRLLISLKSSTHEFQKELLITLRDF